jgi:dTDP-4-dehydrorhamnose reductase
MKILVTGATSRLGSQVVNALKGEFAFYPIGRNTGEYPWQLGVRLDPEQFRDINAIVHFAWSLHDRENDFHLNVGGTAELARFAKSLGVPFVFISSIAAGGESFYGKSKYQAEVYTQCVGGIVLRVGLVLNSNRYLKRMNKNIVNFVPNVKGNILFTEINDLCQEICRTLKESQQKRSEASSLVTLISGSVTIEEAFGNANGINIKIPSSIISLALMTCATFSLKARNYLDAYKSLTSTIENG